MNSYYEDGNLFRQETEKKRNRYAVRGKGDSGAVFRYHPAEISRREPHVHSVDKDQRGRHLFPDKADVVFGSRLADDRAHPAVRHPEEAFRNRNARSVVPMKRISDSPDHDHRSVVLSRR